MRRGLASACALALLAAGCGGGGSSTDTTLSPAEFRQQADAICANDEARIKALGSPTSADELGDYLDKAMPIFEEGNQALHRLNVPDELAADWERAMELQDQSIEDLRELRDAIENQDDARVQELLAELNTADAESTRIARKIGLENCGQESP